MFRVYFDLSEVRDTRNGFFMSDDLARLIEQADQGLFTPTGRKPYKSSIDLTGQVFGLLTVTRRLPNHESGSRWLCQCSCGEQMAAHGGNLRSGGTKSCGCVRRKRGSDSLAWKGHGELTGRHWSIIQSNAKRRGHEFAMTIKDGWDLYERQEGRCALTGWDLVLMTPVLTDVTASLDRIDSSLGYTVGNTQWLHKDVNMAKHVFTQDHFVRMCTAVAANKGRTGH